MKHVPWNITGPMFNGFIQPRLTKVESLALSGYIPEFIFLQVASLKMLLKPLPTASAEVSPVPVGTERYYSSTNRLLKRSKNFEKAHELI